jgi:Right handed beta helix region
VKQVIIHQGVRGIAGSFSDLTVQDSKIADMLWHGVSIVKAKGKMMFADSVIELCRGVGFFGTAGNVPLFSFLNDNLSANSQGGILVNGTASVKVTKCFMYANRYAGIRLVNVSSAELGHNLIKLTLPKKDDGRFGDGIVVECSENVFVYQDPANSVQNFALDFLPPGIEDSARAGISTFSSPVTIENVKFECNFFHAAGENNPQICLSGNEFTYNDLGGNVCGCDLTTVTCQVTSPGLEPPDPIPPTN